MNREQAVNLIKQISDRYAGVWGKSIELLPPKEGNKSSKVEVHFEVGEDLMLLAQIVDIARTNRLAILKTNGTLIVYSPSQEIRDAI
jgi:hypothetical protein